MRLVYDAHHEIRHLYMVIDRINHDFEAHAEEADAEWWAGLHAQDDADEHGSGL